jgi:ankyrin repeat protein
MAVSKLVHGLMIMVTISLAAAMLAHAAEVSLFHASEVGDLAQTKALLATGSDVNARTTSGATALMVASQNGHIEVVQALLAAKADVNAKNHAGFTALSVFAGLAV